MRVTFFRLLDKKVTKERATPSLRPLRCATGQPGVLGHGVRRGTRFALRAPLRQPRRARARSTRAPTRVPPRALRAPGTSSREPGEQTATRAIASLRCARPHLAGASATRCAAWVERSNGPCGWLLPNPLCMRRGAQRAGWHVCRRTHMLRGLARRSCLNEALKARSEFCDAPCPRAPQVAPARSAGDADSGVAFSLVTFFWRRKRKSLACRATPGLRPQHGHAFPTSTPRLRQAQPERSEKTIKNIATSAF